MHDWKPVSSPDRPFINSLILLYIPDAQYLIAPGRDFDVVMAKLKEEAKPLPTHWRMLCDAPEGVDVAAEVAEESSNQAG